MESLVNPDLAWAVLFIQGGRHKYPKLRFVAGAFKGDEWRLQCSYFDPEQTAFHKKTEYGNVEWKKGDALDRVEFDFIPWRLQTEFATAKATVIRVVSPFKICRFCRCEIGQGYSRYGNQVIDDLPDALKISRLSTGVFKYQSRSVHEVRKAVNEFVIPLQTWPPLVYGVCRYCFANREERERRCPSSLVCDSRTPYAISSLKYRGGLKISRKFDSFKRIMRLREKWDQRCENPVEAGFLAAQKGWREKREASLVRAHVPRRKNNKINFFAMVDAVGKLGKLQNQH